MQQISLVCLNLICCTQRNLKPFLSSAHCAARLAWMDRWINKNGVLDSMYRFIHIDKKWFYVKHDGAKIYLTPEEDGPNNFVQHLLWPISANKKMMASLMTKLSDAIKRKWEWPLGYKGPCQILVQMDNALLHIREDHPEWIKARQGKQHNVRLIQQPLQSPDLNVLDLGLWNSLQAAQKKEPEMYNECKLVRGIQKIFLKMPKETIENCFVTLGNFLRKVRHCNSGNKF